MQTKTVLRRGNRQRSTVPNGMRCAVIAACLGAAFALAVATAEAEDLSLGSSAAVATGDGFSPGWSGTVSSRYHDHHTYGFQNSGVVDRVNVGNLGLDGQDPDGGGQLAYAQTYSDTGPPSESCPGGSSITQNASGTAYSHGALAPVGVNADGTYTIAIGGDAAYTHKEHIRDCGNDSDRTFEYGASLPAYAPCVDHPAPKVPDGWDGASLSGSDSCTRVSGPQTETFDTTWRLTRLADRDQDGFPDTTDACPDAFATPDSTDGCPTEPACSDGFDNDHDHLADFPADPGCSSPEDTSEKDLLDCSNGRDDDGDGHVDYPADPGCDSAADTSEVDPPACANHRDDDADGLTDFPADPGCVGADDVSEADGACTTAVTKRAIRSPTYDARVPLFLLPDVDLFAFAPTVRYCWDGTAARVEGANVLGTVDFGVDTGILEYLGFTVEYDLSKQDVSFSPSRNDARIAGEFGVAFDTLSLLNKFGAKKVMEKTLGKTFETAVANVIKTSGYGGAFQTLVRKHAKKTADDLNLGFAKASTGLAGKTPEWFRGTADQIADKAAKNFEGRVDEWLKQVEASLSGANFVGYSGTQVSDTIVAQALAALTEVATIHFPLWQPVYTFAVSPTGVVTDGLDPETYVNPLLLVEDLSGPPPPTPKTGAAKKKGPTVTVPAACPAGANCTGNAFITTSVSTASAAARRPPAPQVAVAHARFKIAAGRKGTLRLKLNRAALKIVRKRGVKLTLVLETTAAGSKSTVVRRKLRLR